MKQTLVSGPGLSAVHRTDRRIVQSKSERQERRRDQEREGEGKMEEEGF